MLVASACLHKNMLNPSNESAERVCSAIFKVIMAMVLCALIDGCATSKPQYEQSQSSLPSASRKSQTLDGIQVTVDWLNEKETTEKYFGVDGSKGDLLILSLRLENRTPASTILVVKTNFAVRLGDAANQAAGRSELPGANTSGAETVGVVGALALSPVLMVAAAGLMTEAETRSHNFQLQELRDRTLSPGETEEGCVYYRLKDARRKTPAFAFDVVTVNTRTQERKTISFNFP